MAAIHASIRPLRCPLTAALSLVLAVALPLAFAACGGEAKKAAAQEQEIKDAITQYLRDSRGIRPDAMKMELRELHLDGDAATAKVRFTSEGAPDGLEFEYRLQQEAGAWKVMGSTGGAHGMPQTQAMPEGHPPVPPEGAPSGETTPPAATQGS